MINYKAMSDKTTRKDSLPGYAKLPINHCNLPAAILGSLTFQRHPTDLYIDGVLPLHKTLFDELNNFDNSGERALIFSKYMSAFFMLDEPDEAGFDKSGRIDRRRAHYLTLLRGWFFNPDGREGAILKGWVESRFGLLPRYHGVKIQNTDESQYLEYLNQRCAGIYNTNALEAQIDLVYSYCQFELARRPGDAAHITLYRGVNDFLQHDILERINKSNAIVLLNNINSFSLDAETAGQFGDTVIATQVPLSKILFFGNLLPVIGMSEKEYAVIGGVYTVQIIDAL